MDLHDLKHNLQSRIIGYRAFARARKDRPLCKACLEKQYWLGTVLTSSNLRLIPDETVAREVLKELRQCGCARWTLFAYTNTGTRLAIEEQEI